MKFIKKRHPISKPPYLRAYVCSAARSRGNVLKFTFQVALFTCNQCWRHAFFVASKLNLRIFFAVHWIKNISNITQNFEWLFKIFKFWVRLKWYALLRNFPLGRIYFTIKLKYKLMKGNKTCLFKSRLVASFNSARPCLDEPSLAALWNRSPIFCLYVV